MSERFVQVTDTDMPDPRPKLEVPENWLTIFPSLQMTQAQKEADKNAEAPSPAEETKAETGTGKTTKNTKTESEAK